MNGNWEPDAELQALLTALVDGEPTDQQLAELARRLQEDSQARAFYLQLMSLHARLHARHAALPTIDQHDDLPADDDRPQRRPPTERRPSGALGRLRGQVARSTRRVQDYFVRPAPLSVTAFVIYGVVLAGLIAFVVPPIYRAIRSTSPAAAPIIIAQITDIYDARWATGQTALYRGTQLAAGDGLSLDEGFVEVTFRDGARVLLDGPVEFQVDHFAQNGRWISVGRMPQGQLTARVPATAVGFTVVTPHINVVDLGTEFGVIASADSADVEVFEGKVIARPVQGNVRAATTETPIKHGNAFRFPRDQQPAKRIALTKHRFLRLPGDEPLAGENNYVATVLADGPQCFWRLSEQQSTLAVNHIARPHGVYRGEVVQGAAPRPGDARDGGSAAFDGRDDYVEVAHDNRCNPDEFTIEAWVRQLRPNSDFASLVSSRIDQPSTMGYMIYVTPQGKWEFWTGTGTAQWNTLSGPAAAVGEWTHVVATFQTSGRKTPSGVLEGVASLYLNGQLAVQKNMTYVPNRTATLPLRIGAGATEQTQAKYFFPGNVADVAIYSKSLGPAEIERHFNAAVASAVPPR